MKDISWKIVILSIFIGVLAGSEIMALIHYYNGPHGLTWQVIGYSPLLASNYFIFMFPVALLVGIPGYILLKKTGFLNWMTVVAVGTVSGGLVGFAIWGYVTQVLYFALCGFVASISCWLFYSWRTNRANRLKTQ